MYNILCRDTETERRRWVSSVSYHNTVKSGHRRVEGGGHPEREGWERTGQDRTGQDRTGGCLFVKMKLYRLRC